MLPAPHRTGGRSEARRTNQNSQIDRRRRRHLRDADLAVRLPYRPRLPA